MVLVAARGLFHVQKRRPDQGEEDHNEYWADTLELKKNKSFNSWNIFDMFNLTFYITNRRGPRNPLVMHEIR